MSGVIVLLGIIVILAGLVSMIRPLAFLGIRSRRRGLGVFVGGLAILIVAGWIPSGTGNRSVQQTGEVPRRTQQAPSPEAQYNAAKAAITAKDWAGAREHLNALPANYKDAASLWEEVKNGESAYWYGEAMKAKANKDYPLAYQLLKQAKDAGGKLPTNAERELNSLETLAGQAEKRAASVQALQEAEKYLSWWEEDQQKDPFQRRVGVVEQAQESLTAIDPSSLTSSERQRYQQALNRFRRMTVSIRQQYARQLEENFLNRGMDVVVTLEGQDKATIRLKYVLWSRPLIRQVITDSTIFESPDLLKARGFKRLIFDTQDQYYTIDL